MLAIWMFFTLVLSGLVALAVRLWEEVRIAGGRTRPEVSQALQSKYPPVLREAGIGGTALLYFSIDQEGVVADVRIFESSGHAALDEAALRAARIFRFSPARNRDQPVPVWIQIPLTFTTR